MNGTGKTHRIMCNMSQLYKLMLAFVIDLLYKLKVQPGGFILKLFSFFPHCSQKWCQNRKDEETRRHMTSVLWTVKKIWFLCVNAAITQAIISNALVMPLKTARLSLSGWKLFISTFKGDGNINECVSVESNSCSVLGRQSGPARRRGWSWIGVWASQGLLR